MRTWAGATTAVMVVALGLGAGCGGDSGDGGAARSAPEDEAPAADRSDAGGAADPAPDPGDVDRDFAGVCPTAADIGDRLGQATTFAPELTLGLDPAPEVECHYEFGAPGSDGGTIEGSRQRLSDVDEATLVFEGWAAIEVDGETVAAVDPLDLGDDAVRITYTDFGFGGGVATRSYSLDVVVRTADRLCRAELDASAPTPESSAGRYETTEHVAATLCG